MVRAQLDSPGLAQLVANQIQRGHDVDLTPGRMGLIDVVRDEVVRQLAEKLAL
jgi:hypothetical protein